MRQLPETLQRRECGLIEIGRQHARNFDAGHFPSGGGVQRVLTELRKLAKRMASSAAEAATPVRSELDNIRLVALIGSPAPRIESVPPWVTSAGQGGRMASLFVDSSPA